MILQKHGGVIKGSLLVAGTSIGGGMLALPILTGLGGFIPSLFIYLLCWICMASTGLLFLELSLTYGKDANIVTMAEKTLGIWGKAAAWVLYLFLFYCLTIAYMVGCGNLLEEFLKGVITDQGGPILFTLLAAPLVFVGARIIGPVNSYMMFVLGALYVMFIYLGAPYVKTEFLLRRDWASSLFALPIAFTAFAYQGIIPTLSSYMNFDAPKLRKTILIGSFLPLITYIIWQWLILGIVPLEGAGGLKEALDRGESAVQPLKYFIDSPLIYDVGQIFAFFALATSFFGVTLGLIDFLADGLKIHKTPKGRASLALLVFIPPLIFAINHPRVFLAALDYAGGYGCALLLGLLPVLMVWSKRYKSGDFTNAQLKGGRIYLIILIVFVLFEVACELATHLYPEWWKVLL